MLTAELSKLLDTLDAANFEPPHDLAAALGALPPAGTLPAPHDTWTLLALAHYGARKLWAYRAIHTRLAPAWARRHGSGPLEEVTGRFILPGAPDWDAELDGNDSYLVHRTTGERVHIDMLNGPGLFSRGRFAQYLLDHRQPGPAERRVLELHPRCEALPLALDALMIPGALHEVDEGDFELCGWVGGRAEVIGAFLDAWEGASPPARVWLAARIGDWPAAHDAARAIGDPALAIATGPRAEASRRRRLSDLRVRAEAEGLDGATLHAMADAGAEDLPRYLDIALRAPGDATAAALERIGDDPAHVPAVAALYETVLSGGSWWAHLRVPSATYLARHGQSAREVIEALAAPGGEPAEAAVLALEHAPDAAPPLLRGVLREKNNLHRLTAAAALALVDRHWSRRELRAVLDESDDPDVTLECRAALRASRDPEARRAAVEWEASHPELGADPWLSDRSMYDLRGGCDRALAARMAALRDRIQEAREPLSEGDGSTAPPP